MLEYELLHFKPSHIASAATLLAKLYTNDTQGIRWAAGGPRGQRSGGRLRLNSIRLAGLRPFSNLPIRLMYVPAHALPRPAASCPM